MIAAAPSGSAGPPATQIPPSSGAPDRSSAVLAAAGAAARGIAELAIEAAAPRVAKATKAKTSRSSSAKRSAASKSSSKGYAKKTTSSSKASSSKSKSADPLAFLSDPKLSIEDKLMRLLAHLNAQYEEQMQQHMDALAGKTSSTKAKGTSGSSGTKKKTGGLLGALASVVKKVAPSAAGAIVDVLKDKTLQGLLKKLGGPVLAAGATALGFPALAPVLMKLGPELASGAVDLAKALDAETKAAGGSASASSAGASEKTELSSSEQQVELMKLQRVQEKQKEMFSTVSAILRAQHEIRSGIIGNIR
jgi:hypothetical protein